MGYDYKDVTFLEYQNKKLEMLNELGRKSGMCAGVKCEDCPFSPLLVNHDCNCNFSLELLYPEEALKAVMSYNEIDWTKVPVNTKILVKISGQEQWRKRHFAKFENEKVYAYGNGGTSFTTGAVSPWDFAKLYKEEENE